MSIGGGRFWRVDEDCGGEEYFLPGSKGILNEYTFPTFNMGTIDYV